MAEAIVGVLLAAVATYLYARGETRSFLAWWCRRFREELPTVAQHLEGAARSWADGNAQHYHSILESPNIEGYLVGRLWLVPRRVFRALVVANHMRIAMEYFQRHAYELIASAEGQVRDRKFFMMVSEAYAHAALRARRSITELDSVLDTFYLRPDVGAVEDRD